MPGRIQGIPINTCRFSPAAIPHQITPIHKPTILETKPTSRFPELRIDPSHRPPTGNTPIRLNPTYTPTLAPQPMTTPPKRTQ